MYSLQSFGKMITDTVRMEAFTEAMRRTIHPGSVVVDIGAGTGIFALIACQLGAARVYALEPNPLLELGKPMAASNGFADRIVFIPEMSTRVTLPEQADVIIADIRGRLPLFERIVQTFADARQRLLKPGGQIIPQRDTLYACLVESPDLYRDEILQPWAENQYGLDMRAALPLISNTPLGHSQPASDQILLPPQVWVTLDYTTRQDPNVAGRMTWTAERAGTAHFVGLWFDTQLVEGVGYSGAPEARNPKVYGYTMLPLQQPVTLAPGDAITLDLYADLVGETYITRWNTRVTAAEAAPVVDPVVKADLKQSTFFSTPFSGLRKRVKAYVPRLGMAGQTTGAILALMGQGLPLEEIARRVAAQFPAFFPSADLALARVADLSQLYSD